MAGSASHGQGSGLGGSGLRSLHGARAALPPPQLVGLEQALVAPGAGAPVQRRQDSCERDESGQTLHQSTRQRHQRSRRSERSQHAVRPPQVNVGL